AAVVDERVVQSAIRRAGVERDVLEAARLDRVDHHVRAVAPGQGFSFWVNHSVGSSRPIPAARARSQTSDATAANWMPRPDDAPVPPPAKSVTSSSEPPPAAAV